MSIKLSCKGVRIYRALLFPVELAEFECEREEVKKLEQNLVEVEQTLAKKQTDKKCKFAMTQV